MTCINGKTLYCRKADENVVNVFTGSKKTERQKDRFLSGTML